MASSLIAEGEFNGVVRAVPARTSDGVERVAFVVHIQAGPVFSTRQGKPQPSVPSAGLDAVLVKNDRGDIKQIDRALAGRPIRVRGLLQPCFAGIEGKRLGPAVDNQYLPNNCLRVDDILATD
jgi:hypothetical protein